MSEYIDRENVMIETCSNCSKQKDLVCYDPEPCELLIAGFLNAEPADVAPVVHGRWIGSKYVTKSATRGRKITNTKNICSLCGKSNGRNKYNFCPHCGAKMDLE